MRRLSIIILAAVLLLALSAPAAVWADGQSGGPVTWIGPTKIDSLYSNPGSNDLFVKTAATLFVIPAEDTTSQDLIRAAFSGGSGFWYAGSDGLITAVWIGKSPF